MKRIFSLLLAFLMVFTTTVAAAPAQVSTVETTQETASADDGETTAELEGNITTAIKPGINILTGTSEPLTGENALNYNMTSIIDAYPGTTLSVAYNPNGTPDRVINWHIPPEAVANYVSITWSLPTQLDTLVGHNYVHMKYDFAKVAKFNDGDHYADNNQAWIMHTDGNINNVVIDSSINANSGWQKTDRLVNMLKKDQTDVNTQSTSVRYFRFHMGVRHNPTYVTDASGNQVISVPANTVPTDMYFDNMYFVPAYEFSFYTPDGRTLLKKEYKVFDDDGNIITSYSPNPGLFGKYYVSGWKNSVDGNVVTNYQLKNENVKFYATSMVPAASIVQEGELLNEGDTALLTVDVLPDVEDDVNLVAAQWEIEDPDVATITKNKDGSAVVTAVGEGKTKATVTIGDVTAECEIVVVFPLNVDVSGIKETINVEMNPANYTAMVITLSNTTDGDSYKLNYKAGEHETGSFDIVATTDGKRDYYFDLTKAAYWLDASNVDVWFEGDANVESLTFFKYFEPSYELKMQAKSELLSAPGEEVKVSVGFSSNLEGAYDQGYTLSVEDPDDVASYAINDDGTVLVRANVGRGFVTVNATSHEDPEYVVSKKIYVNVDETKFGHYHDFIGITELDPNDVASLLDGNNLGNTTIELGDGVLIVDRPTTNSGTGGVVFKGTAPGDQKYLVVRTTGAETLISVFYHFDSSATSSSNVASSNGVLNDDGTRTYYIELANVPENAQTIDNYIIQISPQTSTEIIYAYTTSLEPENVAEKTKLYTWDFSTTTFVATQNHGLSVFNGSTVWATKASAMINGVKTPVQIVGTETLSDGTVVYRISTDYGTSGSLTPKTLPQNTKLEDYPYMWFKYRTNSTTLTRLYLMDKDAGGNEAGWASNFVTFEQSDDYTTKVIYLPNDFSAGLNDIIVNMMLSYQGETVLTNVQQDSKGYYVPKANYSYSAQDWIEFDEIVIANYDPFADEEAEIPLNLAISLSATDDEITTEGGSVTVSAQIFANKEISNRKVRWSVNNGCVTPTENPDGSVTLTAINNGEVTLTATSLEDPTFSASIDITVKGQSKKVAAYDFKYLAIGNSYCEHGYNPNFSIWMSATEPTRGMAASKPDLDYFHRVQYYLTTGLNGTMSAERIAGSGLENSGEVSATVTTIEQINANITSNPDFIRIKNHLINERPNVITVQLSENFATSSKEVEDNFYDVVYGMIDEYRPVNSVVVCITPFGGDSRVDSIKKYAQKYGFYVADMTFVGNYSVVPAKNSPEYNTYIEVNGKKYYRGDRGWTYNPYLAWAQYPAYDDLLSDGRAEFRTHPGDVGMDEIGKQVFAQFEKAVPAYLEAKYVVVPNSIAILGEDEITELDGAIQLTAVATTPNNASADVVWSLDNSIIATLSEDGLLTAKHNGTVTVTAVSAYDSEVFATKTIEISGQKETFTLTYSANTTDEVEDLAEPDKFANGIYTLSTLAPSRNGYKFLGWSLTEDGDTVKRVNVEENTTVYAIWTIAEGWHFDEDNNYEGISFGGFNVKVEDGIGTVLSYDEGVTVGDVTLALNSDNFDGLAVSMNLSGTTESNLVLALDVYTTDGTYTYTKDITSTGEFIEYYFDISDVEGTITGFLLKPSAMMCQANVDWIEFVRTSLDSDVSVDKVHAIVDYSIDANGNTFSIDTITVNEGVTVNLNNGTYIIGNVEGTGEISGHGNIIIQDGNDGITTFEIPEKTNEDNIRYAEVDGNQFAFSGNTLSLVLGDDETKLVQIVEKKSDDALTTESSLYYLVDKYSAIPITALSDSMDNINEISLRVKDPVGVRFKAGILNTTKADAIVKEYGFVIALERDLISAGAQLTLDFKNVASGSAYIKGNTDIVDYNDGTTTFFTGVLYGIPENCYNVTLVSKTFMRVEIGGEEYVVYGEPVKASAYQIAKRYQNQELDADARKVVDKIIDMTENGNELGLDYGGLL